MEATETSFPTPALRPHATARTRGSIPAALRPLGSRLRTRRAPITRRRSKSLIRTAGRFSYCSLNLLGGQIYRHSFTRVGASGPVLSARADSRRTLLDDDPWRGDRLSRSR